jgi:hypothetical protein
MKGRFTMRLRHLLFTLACVVALVVNPAFAGDKIKNQTFVVNLTSPISTKDSKPGDTITALVLEPSEFQGAVIEGHVRKVEPAKNMEAPKASIAFGFETLTTGDTTYKIQADLQDVVNSKGVAKVDEEGQVIAKGNGGKRAAGALGGAGLGSLAGGMLGGGWGALAGAAAGGALGYVIALDVTASSHNIEFYPGTHFTLAVTSKGVDKNADVAAIHKLEGANEAAMTANSAHTEVGSPAPAASPTSVLPTGNDGTAGAQKKAAVANDSVPIANESSATASDSTPTTNEPPPAENKTASPANEPSQAPDVATPSQSATETATEGTASVTSAPGGADIFIDSVGRGRTPALVRLKPGKHSVQVVSSGYKDWVSDVEITAGSTVDVSVTLQK